MGIPCGAAINATPPLQANTTHKFTANYPAGNGPRGNGSPLGGWRRTSTFSSTVVAVDSFLKLDINRLDIALMIVRSFIRSKRGVIGVPQATEWTVRLCE